MSIQKGDFSDISNIHGWYSLPNTVQCLLNIADLRWGLAMKLDNKDWDLGLLLDKIALNGPCSPKIFIKEVQSYRN